MQRNGHYVTDSSQDPFDLLAKTESSKRSQKQGRGKQNSSSTTATSIDPSSLSRLTPAVRSLSKSLVYCAACAPPEPAFEESNETAPDAEQKEESANAEEQNVEGTSNTPEKKQKEEKNDALTQESPLSCVRFAYLFRTPGAKDQFPKEYVCYLLLLSLFNQLIFSFSPLPFSSSIHIIISPSLYTNRYPNMESSISSKGISLPPSFQSWSTVPKICTFTLPVIPKSLLKLSRSLPIHQLIIYPSSAFIPNQ